MNKKKRSSRTKGDFGDPELNEIFEKIYKMDEKIHLAINKITEKGGFSKEELYSYFDDPKNFTAEQIEKFDQDKNALEKKLIPVMGVDWKKRRKTKQKKKLVKKRKGKTLGGRKGWISMR